MVFRKRKQAIFETYRMCFLMGLGGSSWTEPARPLKLSNWLVITTHFSYTARQHPAIHSYRLLFQKASWKVSRSIFTDL